MAKSHFRSCHRIAAAGLALGADSLSNFSMKHAGAAALDRLEPLLKDIRKLGVLHEKSRGCFYRSGRGFLHFHEHGEDELYADIRMKGDDFERLAASTGAQRKALLRTIVSTLRDGTPPPKR